MVWQIIRVWKWQRPKCDGTQHLYALHRLLLNHTQTSIYSLYTLSDSSKQLRMHRPKKYCTGLMDPLADTQTTGELIKTVAAIKYLWSFN